jgi:PncC family amidohydrolase
VAYANALKIELLGVDAAVLEAHGAVSEPVAASMAEGVRVRTAAGIGVAITGIAGPDGGSATKPVGTVVIAVSIAGQPLVVGTHLFAGDREMVRVQATQAALNRVRLALQA